MNPSASSEVVGMRRRGQDAVDDGLRGRLETASSAVARAHRMHGGQREVQTLETLPALADLLPGGALRCGAAYSVEGSTALAMAMVAGPSMAGAWCGVVGLPGFGAEAAAGFGIDLDRLVLVPDPGQQWMGTVGALVDVLAVVVVGQSGSVGDAEASRLAVRLRHQGGVLIVCGPWPQCDARLRADESSWLGLGSGHGHLAARTVTVTAQGRGTAVRPRRARLWLPDAHGQVRPAREEAFAPSARLEPGWMREAAG
jgi:hypothetical protein